MGDILDSLFSVLPIVLAILWLVRRTTKSAAKRKRTDQAARDNVPPARGVQSRSARASESRTTGRGEKKFGLMAAKAIENFLGESFSSPQGELPRGEEELYEKLDGRKIEVIKAAIPRTVDDETTHRTLKSTANQDHAANGPRPASTLERISKLPPLAQGMIWSFILDEPPGMRSPGSD